jgi:Glutamate-cysteine ligase family 2(GCS2)
MPLETFKASKSLTMGVELELQLVNTYDMDLSSSANDLLELLKRKPFPGVVTPEMTQSMIEIATDIQTEHGPLLAQLREIRNTLVMAGDRLNIELAGGGTHPFQRWFEQRIFSKPRFQELSGLYGYTINPGTDTIHRAITALEPFGWDSRTPDKDASCVWNKAADRFFIDAAVIWAELGFRESC